MEAVYGVGIEGGATQISGIWYESSWVVVVDRKGQIGVGSSAKFELSKVMMEPILKGEELATVIDRLSGQNDVRSGQGAIIDKRRKKNLFHSNNPVYRLELSAWLAIFAQICSQ